MSHAWMLPLLDTRKLDAAYAPGAPACEGNTPELPGNHAAPEGAVLALIAVNCPRPESKFSVSRNGSACAPNATHIANEAMNFFIRFTPQIRDPKTRVATKAAIRARLQ